jgi:4-amino-4-deoxy-L-arabinose transferase-like glycosyltransferase
MKRLPNHQIWLVSLLIVALILRLLFILFKSQTADFITQGGDAEWYLQTGYRLVTGYDFSEVNIPTPPFYLVFVGLFQVIFGGKVEAVLAIRFTQAVVGMMTCFFVYRLGHDISHDERVGLVSAGIVAVSPVFIMEVWQITTETWYIFFIVAGLSYYIRWFQTTSPQPKWILTSAAILFGMATLTRAVSLLFPLGLVIHLFIINWRSQVFRWAQQALLLVVVYILVAGTWTFYNLIVLDRFVIGAEGFAAFLYIGASGWEGPFQTDANLAQELGENLPSTDSQERQSDYIEGASNIISRDPLGYIARRISELATAYLQPHGTEYLGGQSLKQQVMNWWQSDRTLAGLLGLTQFENFWPKLAIYTLHFTGFVLGTLGIWWSRWSWRLTLPLIGFILYTSLLHLALFALPRYIFPTQVVWWVFAAFSLVAIVDELQIRRKRAKGEVTSILIT